MTSPQDLSRTASFASSRSQESTSSQNAAALLGATTAFGRPVPNSRASNNKPNGALAAATSAGSPSARPLMPSSTGDSLKTLGNYAARDTNLMNTSNMSSSSLPLPPARQLSKSPSQQAATFAAAHASPPSVQTSNNGAVRTASIKSPAVPPKPRQLSSYTKSVEAEDTEAPTDSTSIAPTTSLVDMFEKKGSSSKVPGKKFDSPAVPSASELPVKAPQPLRTTSGITSMIQMEMENPKSAPTQVAEDATQISSRAISSTDETSRMATQVSPTSPVMASKPPMPPPRKGAQLNTPDSTHIEPTKSSNPPRGRTALPPTPVRSKPTEPIPIEQRSRAATSPTSPTETFSPSSASAKSITAQYNLLHPQRATKNLTSDSLANAMVAGSLASRNHSPAPTSMEPPPLPTRRHKHTFSLSRTRTPSPAKAGLMKKTLRETQSDADEEEDEDERWGPYSKHKSQKWLGKHPNKHHEGDRKRWRESVSEHERKRYEGVWAANKGLYCTLTLSEQALVSRAPESQEVVNLQEAISEQVSNIVVKDIWSRSRLSESVLETVWDLVDVEGVGRLTKEEFVIGLWLIDGRLKGKKLPVKVSESVWRSVKDVPKIKIRR